MAPLVTVGSQRDCPPKKNDTISHFSKCPKAANTFTVKSQVLPAAPVCMTGAEEEVR